MFLSWHLKIDRVCAAFASLESDDIEFKITPVRHVIFRRSAAIGCRGVEDITL